MKKFLFAAAIVLSLPTAAFAQEEAPDGTPAFGIEPYVGVLAGYHVFDKDSEFGSHRGGRMNGGLISGVAGINVPVGPAFVGVEGNATKCLGDIDWEYVVRVRAGVRAGDSGMIFASAGYQWVNDRRTYSDHTDWLDGLGVEVRQTDICLC